MKSRNVSTQQLMLVSLIKKQRREINFLIRLSLILFPKTTDARRDTLVRCVSDAC